MKTIILALVATMSLPAFASNICSKSWDDVNKSNYATDFPKAQFGSTWVSVDGVCVAGENLQTIKPVEVCVEFSTGERSDCIASENKILSTPINYVMEVPVGDGDRLEQIPASYPLSYEIPVGYQNDTFTQVCTKTYALPTCK
jgi:hypothetical protein